ncbi:Na(+)/H(+) antiporter subunit G [bacterium HR10]|nr:Na(+)/H(+) antiporter subunit G [bacterium HR10]
MSAYLVAGLLLGGAAFMLIAAVGLIRMPDLFTRMHATSKAGSLGAGLILVAVALYYGDLGISARALATIAFILLTAPIAAHVIGRAAYFVGVPFWEGTLMDELRASHLTKANGTAPEEPPSSP